jgi:3-oxoadipate enol-lactonase
MTSNTAECTIEGSSHWALLERAAIRYTMVGDTGRPLLLLHEMGGSLDSWDPVLQHLPRNQRIIRCDVRGSGGSEKIRSRITCDEMVEDIVCLLDHLRTKEPVDVAGVAMGGCFGLKLAINHAHRVHRLASINPPTQATGKVGEALHARAKLAEEGGMRAIADASLARSYPEFLREERSVYEGYRARFIANDPTSYAHIVRAVAEVDLNEVLGSISTPTLFISGRNDLVRPPADTAAVAKRVPGAGFLEIDGGHMPSVQAPAAMARALAQYFGLRAHD